MKEYKPVIGYPIVWGLTTPKNIVEAQQMLKEGSKHYNRMPRLVSKKNNEISVIYRASIDTDIEIITYHQNKNITINLPKRSKNGRKCSYSNDVLQCINSVTRPLLVDRAGANEFHIMCKHWPSTHKNHKLAYTFNTITINPERHGDQILFRKEQKGAFKASWLPKIERTETKILKLDKNWSFLINKNELNSIKGISKNDTFINFTEHLIYHLCLKSSGKENSKRRYCAIVKDRCALCGEFIPKIDSELILDMADLYLLNIKI